MQTACNSHRFPHFTLIAALCVALAFIPDVVRAQDERNGFYAGLQLGAAFPTNVNSGRRYLSHPTRCDVLLYPPSVSPPANDPACQADRPGVTSNEFDPGVGLAGGFMLGYAGSRLRFEVEYLNVSPGGDESPIGGTTSAALLTKTSEWSVDQPPFERIGDYTAHQVFANLYYDFRNNSRWTPFVGGGIGWVAIDLDYYLQFIRKPEAEYLQIEFDPDWPDVAKRAAAGTASTLDTSAGENVFGYQALAGIDYALGEHVSLGIMARWAWFGDVKHDALYDTVRSHAPVHADGVTPWNNELEFSSLSYKALAINLKYHF